MTRGQWMASGVGMGLVVGLLAGWVIGNAVGVLPLTAQIKELRDAVTATREDVAQVRKEPEIQRHEAQSQLRTLEDTKMQFQQLQKCAVIRVDVKKDNDKVVYLIGDRKVELEDLRKVLQELVTWDDKPDLLVVRHDKVQAGEGATVEEEAKETKKYKNTYNLEELPTQ